MDGTCIFCGQPNRMSKEHIFPKWLQDYLGVGGISLSIHLGNDENSEIKSREMIYGGHLNGKVCQQCNRGWMSKVEVDVKPIIITMLDGYSPTHISQDESQKLARWIHKTALTLHAASLYPSSIPDEHYGLAFKQIAPAHLRIAVAHCSENIVAPFWIQNQNWPMQCQFIPKEQLKSEIAKTYRITFGFRNFVARVSYFPLPYRLLEFEGAAVQYVHPGTNGFTWPPSNSIENIFVFDQSLRILDDPNKDQEAFERLLELATATSEDGDSDHAQ